MARNRLSRLPAYQYRPLGEREFRIVHLHPGSRKDKIIVTLQTFDLKDDRYSAVSYAWGNTDRVRKIYAGNISHDHNEHNLQNITHACRKPPCGYINVTENLYCLLIALRDEVEYRVLWVDSLCINQDDPAEKTHQVEHMMSIYGVAYSTIVYVGEHDDVMNLAFLAVRTLACLGDAKPGELPHDLDSLLPPQICLDIRKQWDNHTIPMFKGTYVTAWIAFMALLELPWFHRVWVVQEVVLSGRLQIFTSNGWLSWSALVTACEVVDRGRMNAYDTSRAHIRIPLHLERQRQSVRRAMQAELEGGLSNDDARVADLVRDNHFISIQIETRGCGASDPRDHVFALLGIAKGGGDYLPRVDYSMSLAEVYVRTAYAWFRNQKLNPLQFLMCVNGSYDCEELPTWAPDWRLPWNLRPLTVASAWSPSLSTCQRHTYIEFPDMAVSPLTSPLRLRIRGCRLLNIQDVEVVKAHDTWAMKRHSTLINKFPEPYPTTYLSYKDAFVQTVQPPKTSGPNPCFQPPYPRSESFWSYRNSPRDRTRLRPLFPGDSFDFHGGPFPFVAKYHSGPKAPPTLYVPNTGHQRGPNEPHYTQKELYSSISIHHRLRAVVPQDSYVRSRVWFITDDGFMGLTHSVTKPGDVIVHLFGANTPHVLREKRTEDGNVIWGYVGEVYVLGLMDGEPEESLPEDLIEDFILE